MPAALRNQRAPTAGDTPAPTAASSREHPAAMAAQNRWRSSRRATEGRPGEGNAPRPARSERRFRMAIATSSLKVLRRPLEPKRRQPGILMNVHPVLREDAEASQLQLPRSEPDGQPNESSHLMLKGFGRNGSGHWPSDLSMGMR